MNHSLIPRQRGVRARWIFVVLVLAALPSLAKAELPAGPAKAGQPGPPQAGHNVLFAGTAQANPAAAQMKNPVAATPESIAAGKQLYQRHCASCHGTNGEGGSGNDLIPAAPDLTDQEWKHGSTDGEIFSAIKNGVPPDLNMIPFGDQIKDPEIWNLVNYIRSIAKK
jgi:mono/diheme cytochrome c family protein